MWVLRMTETDSPLFCTNTECPHNFDDGCDKEGVVRARSCPIWEGVDVTK